VVQGTPSGAVIPTARRFGRYETIARIATGGMAEVYLARQTGPLNFSKLVVIKTIHPHLAAERELVDMLLDEARIAAQLKHPHIVDIYDLGEEGDTYFIAMEYLAGASLADVLVAGKQTERVGLFSMAALVAECADALHAAHTWSGYDGRPLGLVHRDVTPANIIVLYTGEVKLVDFGIAKARGRAVVTGTDHRLKGKIGYVAPEQLDGAEADPRCDVFSLGIVLWEALTYRRLFWAPTEAAVVRAITGGELVPPSRWNPQVPRELDDICLRALARRPGDRYQTARAMCDDLRALLRAASYHDHERVISAYMVRTFADRAREHEALFQGAGRPAGQPLAALPALRAQTSDEPEIEIVAGAHGAARLPLPARAPTRLPSDGELGYGAFEPVGGPGDDIDGDIEVDEDDSGIGDHNDITEAQPIASLHLTSQSIVTQESVPARHAWQRRVVAAVATLGIAGGAYAAYRTVAAPASSVPAPAPAVVADERPASAVAVLAAEPALPAPAVAEMPAPVAPTPVATARSERPTERRPRPLRVVEPSDNGGGSGDALPSRPQGGASTPQGLYNEGMRLQVAGDTTGAIARFKAAVAANGRFAPAYRGLGLAYERQGRSDRAARAFQTYLALAGDAADAAAIRARLARLGAGARD
jgi:tRNA A-37 threonylcarbamoyl transferase component Bud32